WTAFALKKPTRDLAAGVSAFLIIDGQGEERGIRCGFRLGGGSDQNDGITHADLDRATGLAGNFPRFQRHLMGAETKGLRIRWTDYTHFLFPTLFTKTKSADPGMAEGRFAVPGYSCRGHASCIRLALRLYCRGHRLRHPS